MLRLALLMVLALPVATLAQDTPTHVFFISESDTCSICPPSRYGLITETGAMWTYWDETDEWTLQYQFDITGVFTAIDGRLAQQVGVTSTGEIWTFRVDQQPSTPSLSLPGKHQYVSIDMNPLDPATGVVTTASGDVYWYTTSNPTGMPYAYLGNPLQSPVSLGAKSWTEAKAQFR